MTEMTPQKSHHVPDDWRERFLHRLRQYGNVSDAARFAGVSRNFVYTQRDADLDFLAAWEDALDESCDGMEIEARRRAVEGVEEPVYYKGMEVGSAQRYSDTLLMFLLKAHRPEKFRETVRQELTGKDGERLPAPIIYIPQVDGE